jgi:hypothetical protein
MFTRYLLAAVAAVALSAFGGSSRAIAADQRMAMQNQEISTEHQLEMAKTAADHEAIAKRFEDEAAQLEKQATEHERLAKRYRGGMGIGPKTNAESLASHCDGMVKNLRASAQDAREMARIHHDIAQQLAK